MYAMAENGRMGLGALKASLRSCCEAYQQEPDVCEFQALNKSLTDLLDTAAHAQSQLNSEASSSAASIDEIEELNELVSRARQQLQTRCELLQVRLPSEFQSHMTAFGP